MKALLAVLATSLSFEAQVAEYIQKFPYQVTYDYTLRYTHGGDPKNFNRWIPDGGPSLVRAGNDIIPRTNNDTYLKGAALLLEGGPVVLESRAPSRGRFSSFQLIDERNVNYRNLIFPAGAYTLYFGKRPAVVHGEAIEVPSAFSIVIARVEVRDPNDAQDVAGARAVFEGMKIGGASPVQFPRRDWLSMYPADVAAEAHRRMDEVFATVPFRQLVVGPGKKPGHDVPYLYHAAGSKSGWGGPDPTHSAFEAIFFDKDGREMSGANGTYTVTTTVPPVHAFWSVTVYDTERGGYFHPNTHNRYHINDTTAARNPDGTVTFNFKRACGAADTNCLEVPAGRFDVSVRYYLPAAEIVAGTWRFPPIGISRTPTRSNAPTTTNGIAVTAPGK